MKILIVTPEPATALKPRVFRFAKLLARHHSVHLAFAEDLVGRGVPPAIRQASDVDLRLAGVTLHPLPVRWWQEGPRVISNLLRGYPLRVSLYALASLRAQVREVALCIRPDVVHVDRERAFSMAGTVDTPTVVDLADPVGWYFEQRAVRASLPRSYLCAMEAERLWGFEEQIAQFTTAVAFASDFGARTFRSRVRTGRVAVVFNPLPESPAIVACETNFLNGGPSICFAGNLYYPPNVEAISRFCVDCWPAILDRIPSATLHIAGSRPSRAVRALERVAGVFVHANPTRMRSILGRCHIAVAPLTLCAGFPNKIVDAVVEGDLAVVASPAARLGLPDAVRERLHTASCPSEWAECISRFWEDPVARHEHVCALRAAMQSSLSDELVLAQLEAFYDAALAG